MIRRARWAALLISLLAALGGGHLAAARAEDAPVVRAVLFYSPTCGHCHKVMTEDLPPLMEHYGDQLQILAIDATQSEGKALYQAAIERFAVPEERQGYPSVFVGSVLLMGSYEIPERLPDLIEYHLANDGVDWPDIPGLEAVIPQPVEESAVEATPEERPGMVELFKRDPVGNSLAVVVLVGMVASLPIAASRFGRRRSGGEASKTVSDRRIWIVTLLCVLGLGVAIYLAFVEITQTRAVCGPVGDCVSVQESEYARLFGLIPIGVMGMVGYILILAAMWLGRFASGDLKRWLALAVFGMALFGTLFSIYLTFLEPFVIGATCAWCLSSAVLMTAVLLAVTDLGAFGWAGFRP